MTYIVFSWTLQPITLSHSQDDPCEFMHGLYVTEIQDPMLTFCHGQHSSIFVHLYRAPEKDRQGKPAEYSHSRSSNMVRVKSRYKCISYQWRTATLVMFPTVSELLQRQVQLSQFLHQFHPRNSFIVHYTYDLQQNLVSINKSLGRQGQRTCDPRPPTKHFFVCFLLKVSSTAILVTKRQSEIFQCRGQSYRSPGNPEEYVCPGSPGVQHFEDSSPFGHYTCMSSTDDISGIAFYHYHALQATLGWPQVSYLLNPALQEGHVLHRQHCRCHVVVHVLTSCVVLQHIYLKQHCSSVFSEHFHNGMYFHFPFLSLSKRPRNVLYLLCQAVFATQRQTDLYCQRTKAKSNLLLYLQQLRATDYLPC